MRISNFKKISRKEKAKVEELNSLTSKILEISRNNETTNNLVAYIRHECEQRKLDLNKVAKELIRVINSQSEIRNITPFLKAVLSRLDDKEYRIHNPMYDTLSKALRQKGITGETWELFLVHAIEEHCLKEFNVNPNELMATNQAIVTYCETRGIKTLKEFKDLLLRSKLLKDCNVPIVVLEKQSKELAENYKKTLEELEDERFYGEAEENGKPR